MSDFRIVALCVNALRLSRILVCICGRNPLGLESTGSENLFAEESQHAVVVLGSCEV
jgi:hypothetical protein